MIAREHTGGSVIAQGSDICGSTGSGEGWLQNEEKEETKGIKNKAENQSDVFSLGFLILNRID